MNAQTAYELHASLLLSSRKRARDFAAMARDPQLNADQADYARDCAYDARKDAIAHLHAARRFKFTAQMNRAGLMAGRQRDRYLGVVIS